MTSLTCTRKFLILITLLLTLSKNFTSQEEGSCLLCIKLIIDKFFSLFTVLVQISDDGANPALGQSYALTCNVSGVNVTTYNYQWMKDEIILNKAESTISFQPLGLSDAGLYTCAITASSASYNNSFGITLQCKLKS